MRIRTAIYQPTQIGENVPDAKKCDDGVHTSTPRSISEADGALSPILPFRTQ